MFMWPKPAAARSTAENSKVCIECGTVAPPTDENNTLITMQHGWRLTRSFDTKGRAHMEWRCSPCWATYRKKNPP